MTRPFQVCSRCVMDTTDAGIGFDAQGVCNHCRGYDATIRPQLPAPEQARRQLTDTIRDIKATGRGRRYDCILGLSGGTDSSYLAWLAWKHGLRTLLVHMDNGWDSELAVKNIENIVRKTGFDYFNHVIDWEEFRDLQLAYLRASVVDVEVVTDHAIAALLYRTASAQGIRYILSGINYATEAIMPRQGWYYQKNDLVNLRAIHRRFGSRRLRTYPTLGLHRFAWDHWVRRIRIAPLLNKVDYHYETVLQTLQAEFGWRFYGRKHGESVFTKFYQNYILPTKFGVDKRKPHLSSLILAGQLTRERALKILAQPLYEPDELREERIFVLKKLGLTTGEFDEIMRQPPVPHERYPSHDHLRLVKLERFLAGHLRRFLAR